MKPVNLAADWHGEPPRIGEWFRARRGRTAYEIVAVRKVKSSLSRDRYMLTCQRHSPSDIPPGTYVGEWFWNKRLPA